MFSGSRGISDCVFPPTISHESTSALKHINVIIIIDRLFGIVVTTSDCHPKDPRFDSRLYLRNVSGSVGSETGSTQPHGDNSVPTWLRSSEVRLRKLTIRLRDNCLLTRRSHILSSGSNRFSRSWLFGAWRHGFYYYYFFIFYLFIYLFTNNIFHKTYLQLFRKISIYIRKRD